MDLVQCNAEKEVRMWSVNLTATHFTTGTSSHIKM